MNIHITIDIPDSLATQAEKIEKSIKLFADEKIQESLETEAQGDELPKMSRWAKLSEQLQNDPDLKDPKFRMAWKNMKEDMAMFRKEFRFKHDFAEKSS